MKNFPTRALAGALGAAALLGVLLVFPADSVAGVRAGLDCCVDQVIPALFPFFVAASLAAAGPLARWLGLSVWPVSRLCLGLRGRRAATALLLAWLGGFAVASRTVDQLYRQGQLDRRHAQLLLVAGVGSSPGFVVNAVGCLMLGSPRLGWCLLAALLAADLVAGVVFRFALPGPRRAAPEPPDTEEEATDLVAAIGGAVQSMLTVCGFVVFFSFLARVLARLLPAGGWATGAAMLLEVTGGCVQASALPGAAAVYGCCAALSLQSLSVLLQVRALVSRELSLLPLLAARPLHLAVSLAALRLLLGCVPGAAAAARTLGGGLIVSSRTAPDTALVLFALCCAVLYGIRFTTGKGWGIMDENRERRRRHVP